MLLAYFGPETYLPLTSVLASIVGVVLLFGKSFFRLLTTKAWRRAPREGPWRGAARDGSRLGPIRGEGSPQVEEARP